MGLILASVFHCFEQMLKFIQMYLNTFGILKVGQNMFLLDTHGQYHSIGVQCFYHCLYWLTGLFRPLLLNFCSCASLLNLLPLSWSLYELNP